MPREQDTLAQIGKDFCEELGFNPTSSSTKPLYVANSLFRWCTGIECELRDLHEWTVSERKPRGVASEVIVQKYSDAIYDPSPKIIEEVKETRYYLDRLFNPDSTVHPSYRNSVLNISSKWFVRSRVNAEANIGRFLFKLLNTPISGKRSPAIDLIGQALADDADDLSSVVKPIIVLQPEMERIKRTEVNKDLVADMNSVELVIRAGFDRLAQNCALDYGHGENNSLLTLRRIVNFAMFAVFYYLEDINRVRYGGQRIPLLLDADGRLDAIESASEACFVACKRAVEEFTAAFIQDWLSRTQVISDTTSQDSCLQYISSGLSLSSANENKNVREIVQQHIKSNCNAGDAPLLATAKALQFALYTYTYPNTTPSDFCNVLGTRAGLVNPTKAKRFRIDRFLLETIMLSVVDADLLASGIELQEFGELLRNNYNIIIGTDVDQDYLILDQCGIAGATPENLRGELSSNARIIADMLISMGVARRYADGVTIIGREV